MAWKRAMVRAARAMATVTRVAGDEEGDGDGGRSDGNGNDADINKCFFILFLFLVRLTNSTIRNL